MRLPRIEIWWMRYDPASELRPRAWADLPASDRWQAQRMPSRRRGREWAAGRWLVRFALGRRLGGGPWAGPLEPGHALARAADRARWSLSHDGGVMAAAVTDGCAVGIDVLARGSCDAATLAAIERALPAHLPGADVCDRWMRAEALLKCTGSGWTEAASMTGGGTVPGATILFHTLQGGRGVDGVVATDARDVPIESCVCLP